MGAVYVDGNGAVCRGGKWVVSRFGGWCFYGAVLVAVRGDLSESGGDGDEKEGGGEESFT